MDRPSEDEFIEVFQSAFDKIAAKGSGECPCHCVSRPDDVLAAAVPKQQQPQQQQPYSAMPYAVDQSVASFDPRLMHHPPPVSVAADPFYSPSGSVYASCDTSAGRKRKREPHDEAADGTDSMTGQQDWAATYSSPTYSDSFAISGKNPYSNASDSYSYPMETGPDSGWSAAAYGVPFSGQSASGLPHHHSHQQDEPAPPPYLHPDTMYDGSGLPPMSSFRSSQFASGAEHHSSLSKGLYAAHDHTASGYPAPATPVSSPSNWSRMPATTSGSFAGATAAEPVSVHQNLHPIVS